MGFVLKTVFFGLVNVWPGYCNSVCLWPGEGVVFLNNTNSTVIILESNIPNSEGFKSRPGRSEE